jgi:hypothetical protein
MNPLSLLSSRVSQYEPPRTNAADVGKPDEQARTGAPPGAVAGGRPKEAPRPAQAAPPPDGSPNPTPLRGAQTREQKPLGPEPDPAANNIQGIAVDGIQIIHAAPPVTVAPPPPPGGSGSTDEAKEAPTPGPTPPIVAHTLIEEARVSVPATAPITTTTKPKQAVEVPAPGQLGRNAGATPRLEGPPTQVTGQPSPSNGCANEFPGIVPQPSLGSLETPGIVPRTSGQNGSPVPAASGEEHLGIVPQPTAGGEKPKLVGNRSEHPGIVPRPVSGKSVPRPASEGQEAPMPGIVPRPTSGLAVPRAQAGGTSLTIDEALAKVVAIHVDEALGVPVAWPDEPTMTAAKPRPAPSVPEPTSQGKEAPLPGVMPRPSAGGVELPTPKPALEKPVTDAAGQKGPRSSNEPAPKPVPSLGVPVPSPVIADAFEAIFEATTSLDESGEQKLVDAAAGDLPMVEGKPGMTVAHAVKAQDVDRPQPLPEPEAKEVLRQLADRIENMVASRRFGQVVIKLEPYDLGTLTLTVKAFGNRVDAEVTASNETVRHNLAQHRSDLVQNVESRGLSLNSFNVGQEQANGQTFAGYQDAHAEALRTAATARANSDQRPTPTAQPTFTSNALTAIDTVA